MYACKCQCPRSRLKVLPDLGDLYPQGYLGFRLLTLPFLFTNDLYLRRALSTLPIRLFGRWPLRLRWSRHSQIPLVQNFRQTKGFPRAQRSTSLDSDNVTYRA